MTTEELPMLTYASRPSDAACEVLARALDVIIRDPDAWDQADYAIRRESGAVTYCLAGHVVTSVLGHGVRWYSIADSSPRDDDDEWVATASFVGTDPSPYVVERSVAMIAAQALELVDDDDHQDGRAYALFDARISLRRLVELSHHVTDGRVNRLAEYHALVAARPDVAARDSDAERRHVEDVLNQVASLVERAARCGLPSPLEDTSQVRWVGAVA